MAGWRCVALHGATEETSQEYQLKAVCLLRFAQFVEWPKTAFSNSTEPIVIGVLGQDPFGGYLEAAAKQVGAIRNRPFIVQRYRQVRDMKTCHILFISADEDSRLQKILIELQAKPILTVGETEGFAQRGGMIRFTTVENRLRFRVNLAPTRRAGLELSSKLLRWAEVMGVSP